MQLEKKERHDKKQDIWHEKRALGNIVLLHHIRKKKRCLASLH